MVVRFVTVQDADLEVYDWGTGEPLVFLQTALTADDLLPLARQPLLAEGYRKILYHRRGYARSSPADGPGSVARDAADVRLLLAALGIERAHIVGVSYSGAIGLQLAADAPAQTHTLTVSEPPPVITSHESEFRAVNEQLHRTRREKGVRAALEEFLTGLIGANWRESIEHDVPGAVAQIELDAATFFDTDVPALLNWRFGPSEASRVNCPVLYMGGTDSGAWFAEVRAVVLHWLPHAEDVVLPGAGHSLERTHVSQVADALAAFLRRHPMTVDATC